MRGVLALVAVLGFAARAAAGPVGAADVHAVAPTGFPGVYLATVRLSLADDPLYGSRLLDAVQTHVQAVTGMIAPSAVAGYLEQSATAGQGMGDLRAKLGREALPSPRAAALLVANALTRPEQFREVMDGLETLKPGLGRHAAEILRAAGGPASQGDPRIAAALRAAGARRPQGEGLTYGRDGRWATLFDGSAAVARGETGASDDAVAVPAAYEYGPGARPRTSGLLKPERP